MAAEALRDVVDGDQSKCAKAPEDEGVREPRQRPLLDHFALRHHFPKELPYAPANRRNFEIGRGARVEDYMQNFLEAPPEERERQGDQHEQNRSFRPRWVCHIIPL